MPREVTSNFAYVRLRRAEYDAATLNEWDAWFTALREKEKDVFVYLKHDKSGASPETLLGRWQVDSSKISKRHAGSTRARRAGAAKRTGKRA